MLEVRGLNKTYHTKGAPPVQALVDVSLKLESTGMVFVLGKSGSGKSTFLNVAGGLDRYDSGEIIIKGKSSRDFKDSDFDSYRNTYLGFIFQEYNLINEFSIGRNIALAMELQNRKAEQSDIDSILRLVDLEGVANRSPLQISGGQRQRVAIARALIKNPEIIMADEPTGALDSATGAAIFQTLQGLSKTRLVLIVSHDREFAERYGDRIIEFKDGRIISDMIKSGEGLVEQVECVTRADVDVKNVTDIIDASKKAGLSTDHIAMLDELLTQKQQAAAEAKKGVKQSRKGKFVATNEAYLNLIGENSQPFSLIRSRLPQKNAVKMALSSMRHKRVRLVFSIILAVIAITLFGFSNVIGGFSGKSLAKSLVRDNNYSYAVLSKQVGSEGIFTSNLAEVSFSDSEKQQLKNLTGGYGSFTSVWQDLPRGDVPVDGKYNPAYFYDQRISGVVASDNLKELGIDIPLSYGTYPTRPNEIVITNYMAEGFLAGGIHYNDSSTSFPQYYQPQKINDVLSYQINAYSISSVPLKIVGIANIPMGRYAKLLYKSTQDEVDSRVADEFTTHKQFEPSFIYAHSSIKSLMSQNQQASDYYTLSYNLPKLDRPEGRYKMSMMSTATAQSEVQGLNYTYLGKDGSTEMPELAPNQVIINISEYIRHTDRTNGVEMDRSSYLLNAEELSQYAEQLGVFNRSLSVKSLHQYLNVNGKTYEYNSINAEVVGVISVNYSYYFSDYVARVSIMHQSDIDVLEKDVVPEKLFVHMENSQVAQKLIDSFFGNFRTNQKGIDKVLDISMPHSSDLGGIAQAFKLMALVFLVLSIVLCVFAALLILSFISASVTLKKKEIGILRAIGARKVDVLSIFLWEGAIIAGIVLVISVVNVFAFVVVFNNLIGSIGGIPFTVLVMGILTPIFMILVCAVTVALASILPAQRVASLKPMDAIRTV